MTQQTFFRKGIWVQAPEATHKTLHILHSRFTVQNARSAMLRVVGLGSFHCYLNGQRVGEDLYLPLATHFEQRNNWPVGETLSGSRLYVPEYDITPYLRDGENTLVIHYGGGWYTTDYIDEKPYGVSKVIWEITGEDDGGELLLGSSEADRIGQSFVTDYHLSQRECQNLAHPNYRVLEDGFSVDGWAHAVPAKPLETEYDTTDCPADRVFESVDAVCIRQAEDHAVYDFGRNSSGFPVLRLIGQPGDKVTVVFAEEKTQDNEPDPRFRYGQTLEYICGGEEAVVQPLFLWFGFRYFSVYGPAKVERVCFVHANTPQIADFRSDVPVLNWLHEAFINTQLSNMHTGIPSDCPHIERRGYTGDGQLICHAAMNLFDCKAFYRKWIRDIIDCQDVNTGHIQYTAPYTHSGGGPGGWGCAIVEVPYQYYRHYGDPSVLAECYPSMLRYFEYLESHSNADLVVRDKEGEWCLGDWCPPTAVVLPAPFVNNYFYIKSLYRCIEIAGLIGRDNDIPLFEERIAARKAASMQAYFNPWDGNFFGGLQGANAFAVDIGLGDERTYQNLVKYYRALGHFDTGIFGTDLVTRVLFEHGDGQLAMDLLTSAHVHSYREMQRRGATSLWEYWPDSNHDRSHNHPMFGAVAAHLYDWLLGIRAEEGCAGYSRVVIQPVLAEPLHKLEGYRTLPAGRVSVGYEIADDKVTFTVTVPQGLPATLVYGDNRLPLQAGENRFIFAR